MRKASLYFLALVALGVPIAAVYFSGSMSFDYIKSSLGGHEGLYVLACIALAAKLICLPICYEMYRAKQTAIVLAIALICACAISVTLFLEASKVATLLSDASASRTFSKQMSEGNQAAIKKLLETQQSVIDRRNFKSSDLQKFNEKMKVQAEWTKATVVSEVEPLLALVERVTGANQGSVKNVMLLLLVILPTLCTLFFPHVSWILFKEASQLKFRATTKEKEVQETHHKATIDPPHNPPQPPKKRREDEVIGVNPENSKGKVIQLNSEVSEASVVGYLTHHTTHHEIGFDATSKELWCDYCEAQNIDVNDKSKEQRFYRLLPTIAGLSGMPTSRGKQWNRTIIHGGSELQLAA